MQKSRDEPKDLQAYVKLLTEHQGQSVPSSYR